MNRRPTHAAGSSWRKSEDPITYYRRAFGPDLLFLASCALFGASAALWVLR